ncbi:Broad-Complex, Tramtrack and Bric a brac [Teratosphaeria destructans]|uniref:Broad-Complex, Tramtrack and Bric a brac n=1 Tax=Teratosphaeria destructans TaxID=418781 RepID=A0A9W7W184_9PEZI|nr:Broad-Complex, Tramtrack and Bric a brac [Teratosphaeria destructans]
MPPNNFDITGFFDQEAYSDITVKFGERQVKCHKMILCTKSEYFKNICGPGKLFAEASHSVIELKEDDEDALLAILRWLYCFDYEDDNTKMYQSITDQAMPDQLDFHAQVYIASDKYAVHSLRDESFKRLVAYTEAFDDDKLVGILTVVLHQAIFPDEITKVVQQVRDDRLHTLLKREDYRTILAGDSTACLAVIDALRAQEPVRDDKSVTAKQVVPATEAVPSWQVEKVYWSWAVCPADGLAEKGAAVICYGRRCANRAIPEDEKITVWTRK